MDTKISGEVAVLESGAPDHADARPVSDPVLAEHVAEIRRLGKRAIEDVIEIGRRLNECKEIVGYGNWLSWLDREFGWSEATALNFMHVHELALSTSANFANLNLPVSTLYLLAAPSTPAAVCSGTLERIGAGEQMSSFEVKETIAKAKRTGVGTTKANKDGVTDVIVVPVYSPTGAKPTDGDDDQHKGDDQHHQNCEPRTTSTAESDSKEAASARTDGLTESWRACTVAEQRRFLETIPFDQIVSALPVEHLRAMGDRLIGNNGFQRSVKLTELLRTMLKTKSPAEQITAIARFNKVLAEWNCDFGRVEVRLSN